MSTPSDRVYAQTHEWAKADDQTVTIGLSRFAVDQLTDVTYAELKPVGTQVQQGESLGEVESVKTTSDVYAPAAGEIVEINQAVVDNPAILNDDPYEAGWLVRIKASDLSQLDALQDAASYDAQHA